MDDFARRLLGGFLIFYLGLHFIAGSIYLNGTNTRINPVWNVLRPLLELEWIAAKAAVVCALGFAALRLGSAIFYSLAAGNTCVEPEIRTLVQLQGIRQEQPTNPPVAEANCIQKQETICLAERRDPPKPSAPTAEELKQKAIEQILRGY